jgi:peptidoglycan/LPS O-acetylase OafA/YrhL
MFTKFVSQSIANLIRIFLLSLLSFFLIIGSDSGERFSVDYFFHHLLVCLLLGCLFSALANQFRVLFLLISRPVVTFSVICLLLPLFILSISYQKYNKIGIVFLSLVISLIANLNFQKDIAWPLKNIDPSYGTYLYAFPINQALIAAGITEWIICLFLTASISIIAGILSYILVEEKFIGAFVYSNQPKNGTKLLKKNQSLQ